MDVVLDIYISRNCLHPQGLQNQSVVSHYGNIYCMNDYVCECTDWTKKLHYIFFVKGHPSRRTRTIRRALLDLNRTGLEDGEVSLLS